MTVENRSDVSIANKALRLIGDRTIGNIDDDNGSAQSVNEFFYSTRNALLEEYDWTFASVRDKASAAVAVPVFGWLYAYAIPVQWLAVRTVCAEPTNHADRRFEIGDYWNIEGRQIVTNFTAPIYIRGTIEVEDAGLFSSLFTELFYHELAVRIGQDRAESVSLSREAALRLGELREAARSMDAAEGSQESIAESGLSWLAARSYQGGY